MAGGKARSFHLGQARGERWRRCPAGCPWQGLEVKAGALPWRSGAETATRHGQVAEARDLFQTEALGYRCWQLLLLWECKMPTRVPQETEWSHHFIHFFIGLLPGPLALILLFGLGQTFWEASVLTAYVIHLSSASYIKSTEKE